MKLYFENAAGVSREIATCADEKEVFKEIHKFVNKCNKDRPKEKEFKIHYVREWVEDGKTWYDVGSWSEFFYVDKELYPNGRTK